jgi:DtxR family transcriptional regulator, manganese transport regulator
MRGRVTGRAEDYLRAVSEIVQQKGCARTNDISKKLNVQQPTVVEMVKKLHDRGFVVYEKYGVVSLTLHGKDIVKIVRKRHDTFQKFLKLISVPEDIASKDADVLEHLLHPETIVQFERFVDFVGHASAIGHPKLVERWMEQFKEYCEKEKQNARAANA